MAIHVDIRQFRLFGDTDNFTIAEISQSGKTKGLIIPTSRRYYKYLPDALNDLANRLAHYKRQANTVEELREMIADLRQFKTEIKEVATQACEQVIAKWLNTITERLAQ